MTWSLFFIGTQSHLRRVNPQGGLRSFVMVYLGFPCLWLGIRMMVGLATKQMCVWFGRWCGAVGNRVWRLGEGTADVVLCGSCPVVMSHWHDKTDFIYLHLLLNISIWFLWISGQVCVLCPSKVCQCFLHIQLKLEWWRQGVASSNPHGFPAAHSPTLCQWVLKLPTTSDLHQKHRRHSLLLNPLPVL